MPKYTKERLEDAVSKSVSIFGVLRILGVSLHSGGMHSLIKNKIKQFGIDTSHFTGTRTNHGVDHKGGNQKLVADSVLVSHRKETKEKIDVLRRALDEIGRKYECSKCGLGQEWNEKKLVLEIHHINNDNLDNRRENIVYLCPNCHSQENVTILELA